MKLRFLAPFTVLSLLILNIGHAQFAEYHISNFRLNPVRFAPELAGADGCKTINSSIYTEAIALIREQQQQVLAPKVF